MDEQRLERALRQGPGFATRYVAGPPVLDESLVAQRSAGGGRLALMIAVTALLVGLVAGAIVVGSGRVKLPVIVPVPSAPAVVQTSPTPDATEPVQASGVVAYSVCTRVDPVDPLSCAGDWRIWVVNDDGTGAHELLPDEPGSQYPIAWSPDGSQLLYSSDSWGDDLALTDAAGSAPEVLPNESLCPVEAQDCYASLSSVAFSPDGGRLAYTIFADADASTSPCRAGGCELGDGTIAVLEIATGQVTRLDASRIPGPLQCCDGYYAPSWSGDGTTLAFAMPPLTSFSISFDGSDLHQLVSAGEGTAPRWSPDGSAIAASLGGVEPTIYVFQPGGDYRTVARDAYDPQWTRDGRIVFSRDSPTDQAVSNWIVDAYGGNERRLDDTISALTAAGCMVCRVGDVDRLVNGMALWQPVPTGQP